MGTAAAAPYTEFQDCQPKLMPISPPWIWLGICGSSLPLAEEPMTFPWFQATRPPSRPEPPTLPEAEAPLMVPVLKPASPPI